MNRTIFDELSFDRVNLAGGGFVQLVAACPERFGSEGDRGADYIIASAARTSFNNFQTKRTPQDDQRLIRYLYKNHHTSPFEMGTLTFLIKAPKFVTIQLLRHRTFRFNEESQRYHQITEGFFHPSSDPERFLRIQDDQNKQASKMDPERAQQLTSHFEKIEAHLDEVFKLYQEAIQMGAARECARFCLPLATWSHLVVQVDMNNLTKFLKLRLNDDAQYEIRLVARAFYHLAKQVFPITMKCFDEFSLTETMLDSEGALMDGIECVSTNS